MVYSEDIMNNKGDWGECMKKELKEGGVKCENVYMIYSVISESHHTRDYAPWFVEKNIDGEMQLCMTDFEYYTESTEANKLNRKLAEQWGIPRTHTNLKLEGGNMMVDGNGRGAATKRN